MATRLVLACIHLKNTRREQKDRYHCADLVSIPGKSFRAFWKTQVQTEAKSPTPALSSVTLLLKAVPASAHHTQPNRLYPLLREAPPATLAFNWDCKKAAALRITVQN